LSPLTEAHREEHVDIVVRTYSSEDPPAEQREYREHLNSLRSPDSLPAVQDLRVDSLGNIWLELFQIPGKSVREYARGKGLSVQRKLPLWVVLGPEGDLLGSVRVPPDLEIKEIGADYLLGIATDEYGTQQVRRYSIRKGPAGFP